MITPAWTIDYLLPGALAGIQPRAPRRDSRAAGFPPKACGNDGILDLFGHDLMPRRSTAKKPFLQRKT
jgi:hypothetical protein